ncbi:MAG: hypothetical protein V2I26_06780 [Halieaceae bacterium]|jgi:hypothetical protein|nr:hypothetical protein [Halieaceae bacterium]
MKTLRNTIVAIAIAIMSTGCAHLANEVQSHVVTMDRSGATYAQDNAACRQISESHDYFSDIMGKAVARGVTAGLVGGVAGGVIGNQFGNAAAGATIGAASAGANIAIANAAFGPRDDTATIVWARCMTSKGHQVYSVGLH